MKLRRYRVMGGEFQSREVIGFAALNPSYTLHRHRDLSHLKTASNKTRREPKCIGGFYKTGDKAAVAEDGVTAVLPRKLVGRSYANNQSTIRGRFKLGSAGYNQATIGLACQELERM